MKGSKRVFVRDADLFVIGNMSLLIVGLRQKLWEEDLFL